MAPTELWSSNRAQTIADSRVIALLVNKPALLHIHPLWEISGNQMSQDTPFKSVREPQSRKYLITSHFHDKSPSKKSS